VHHAPSLKNVSATPSDAPYTLALLQDMCITPQAALLEEPGETEAADSAVQTDSSRCSSNPSMRLVDYTPSPLPCTTPLAPSSHKHALHAVQAPEAASQGALQEGRATTASGISMELSMDMPWRRHQMYGSEGGASSGTYKFKTSHHAVLSGSDGMEAA
jgi:hypothetical protein